MVDRIEIPLNIQSAPNTVIPLGAAGYVVINEQVDDASDFCAGVTVTALRLVHLVANLEIRVGQLAVGGCRIVGDWTIESIPEGGPHLPDAQLRARTRFLAPGPTPTGEVTFTLCDAVTTFTNGGDCSSGGALVGEAQPLHGGATTSATLVDPVLPGSYCWRAEYSGDAYHMPASTTNGAGACFSLEHASSVATVVAEPWHPEDHPFRLSENFRGKAQVQSTIGTVATGEGQFYLCGPSELLNGIGCTLGQGLPVGDSVPLNESGSASSAFTSGELLEGKGTYCWRFEYGGDTFHGPSTGLGWWPARSCVRVGRYDVSVDVDSRFGAPAPDGGFHVDAALTVSQGQGFVTGTVDFYLCAPGQLTAEGCLMHLGTPAGSLIPLSGGEATSNAMIADEPGHWCWGADIRFLELYESLYYTDDEACFQLPAV